MSTNLNDWLEKIARHHPAEIELGLDRCRLVFERLFPSGWSIPTITVAGTNGKGSTIAYLDAMARASHKKVLTFTSPHLIDYRERLLLDGLWLSEKQHIDAFRAIEQAAGEIPLTYFEFSTLSAFYIAVELKVELLLLEVGLGGRLDATNLIATDIAIITTVDLDHQDYLGNTIEAIAQEKLGIVHPSTKVIIADHSIPLNLLDNLSCQSMTSVDTDYVVEAGHWKQIKDDMLSLPLPEQIQPHSNSAAAISAFRLVVESELLPELVNKANQLLNIPGRLQQIAHKPAIYLDVAHNPQAFKHLAAWFTQKHITSMQVVLGMLDDKQIDECLEILQPLVSHWHLCEPDSARARSVENIQASLLTMGIPLTSVSCYASVESAYLAAVNSVKESQETLLVTGSFYTVGPVLKQEQLHVQ